MDGKGQEEAEEEREGIWRAVSPARRDPAGCGRDRRQTMVSVEQGMDRYITGVVYVITTKLGDIFNGQTAAWVTRISQEPFLVAIALYEKNYTHKLLLKSNIFAINILKEGQQEVARHFGQQSRKHIDKFATIKFHKGKTGAPILDDCLAYLDCRVIFSRKFGDHTLFVGEIVDGGVLNEGKSLIYRREDYL